MTSLENFYLPWFFGFSHWH